MLNLDETDAVAYCAFHLNPCTSSYTKQKERKAKGGDVRIEAEFLDGEYLRMEEDHPGDSTGQEFDRSGGERGNGSVLEKQWW